MITNVEVQLPPRTPVTAIGRRKTNKRVKIAEKEENARKGLTT